MNCSKDFLVEWQLKKPGWPYDQLQPLRVVVVIIVVDVAMATDGEEVIWLFINTTIVEWR